MIVESQSVGEAIWKLLAPYETNNVRALSRDVKNGEAKLQASLKQMYYSFVSQLARSLGVEMILLPAELGLIGLPGAI